MTAPRRQRADARRNRERVLAAAIDIFATEGLSVPVHEIARRAGVGTGTVSRHFPTKEALYDAIVVERIGRIVDHAHELAKTRDPGEAFFAFLDHLIEEGATNRGLVEGLAGAGFDLEAAALRTGHDVSGIWRDLLTGAQKAGAVRDDVDVADVKTLVTACLTDGRTGAARRRVLAVIRDGLRADRTS